MFKKIHFKIKRFFRHLFRRYYHLTDRGLYELYYLIDYYINEKKIRPN